MNKKIFGLCDTGAGYTEAFAHFISRHEGGRFDVRAFTRPESFTEYLKTGSFDVLLISEAFASLLADNHQQSTGIPENLTFILTDEENAQGYDFPCIYRLQSSARILAQIVNAFDSAYPKRGHLRRRGRGVMAVYSPVGRCGKTSLALALAERLSQEGRALYVNLEEYCGHAELMKSDDYTGISDLIYKCVSGAEISAENRFKSIGGADAVLGAGCSDDIRSADAQDIIHIVDALKEAGYDGVVLDISGRVRDINVILDYADTVYVPVPSDDVSRGKVALWEDELAGAGYIQLSEKIVKTAAPQPGKEQAHAVSLLGN